MKDLRVGSRLTPRSQPARGTSYTKFAAEIGPLGGLRRIGGLADWRRLLAGDLPRTRRAPSALCLLAHEWCYERIRSSHAWAMVPGQGKIALRIGTLGDRHLHTVGDMLGFLSAGFPLPDDRGGSRSATAMSVSDVA